MDDDVGKVGSYFIIMVASEKKLYYSNCCFNCKKSSFQSACSFDRCRMPSTRYLPSQICSSTPIGVSLSMRRVFSDARVGGKWICTSSRRPKIPYSLHVLSVRTP